MPLQNFEVRLAEDLLDLIKVLGLPVVTMVPLTTLPSRSERACFRLDLADGRILKARISDTTHDAARIEYLMQFLDPAQFPKIVARQGCTTLTEWVNGRCLTSADCAAYLLAQCGSLQGSMHCIRLPGEHNYRYSQSCLERQEELDKNIQKLADRGIIGNHESHSLLKLARDHAPISFEVGLVHGDFCAENIIVDDQDHMHVIDNETLTIDAFDYDLGRTWYRWPMDSVLLRAYFRGYAQHRSLETFLAHFPYWAISAVVDSALFRLRSDPRTLSTPVERLRTFLNNPRDGTDFGSESPIARVYPQRVRSLDQFFALPKERHGAR